MVEIEHIQDIEKDQPAKSSAKEQKLKDPKDLTTETEEKEKEKEELKKIQFSFSSLEPEDKLKSLIKARCFNNCPFYRSNN